MRGKRFWIERGHGALSGKGYPSPFAQPAAALAGRSSALSRREREVRIESFPRFDAGA